MTVSPLLLVRQGDEHLRSAVESVDAVLWPGFDDPDASRAGGGLTDRVGIGFLARDLLPELTAVVRES